MTMKILQILPQLNVGGVETGTVDLARYLKQRGYPSAVASMGGGLVAQLEAEGIPHHKLPVASKAFWVMLRASRSLRAMIAREKIDIVHARSRVPAWVAFMATRGTGKMIQGEGPMGEESEGAPAAGGGEMVEETVQFIPAVYNTSSKLEADLKASDNPNTNFELEAQDEETDF